MLNKKPLFVNSSTKSSPDISFKKYSFADDEREKKKQKIIFRKNKDYEESKSIRLNCNKAKKYLKWSPKLNIDTAIKYAIDWHKNNKLLNNSYNQCIEQIKSFEKIK